LSLIYFAEATRIKLNNKTKSLKDFTENYRVSIIGELLNLWTGKNR